MSTQFFQFDTVRLLESCLHMEFQYTRRTFIWNLGKRQWQGTFKQETKENIWLAVQDQGCIIETEN